MAAFEYYLKAPITPDSPIRVGIRSELRTTIAEKLKKMIVMLRKDPITDQIESGAFPEMEDDYSALQHLRSGRVPRKEKNPREVMAYRFHDDPRQIEDDDDE